jgi:hypothetical protein
MVNSIGAIFKSHFLVNEYIYALVVTPHMNTLNTRVCKRWNSDVSLVCLQQLNKQSRAVQRGSARSLICHMHRWP